MSSRIDFDDPKYQKFHESLNEIGIIEIAGTVFPRSRILFEMDPTLYEQALNEFLQADFEDLKQTIFDYYPACIAYNYRLSERGEGANDPVRKLLHLKDSWEAIVFVLYALVMGEVRFRQIDLRTAQIFSYYDATGNPHFVNFNTDKILSDAIKQKIQNIRAIVQHCKAGSLGFKLEKIDETLLDDLLQLQDIRNDVSHHAAPTREQAERELRQVLPIFQEMLGKTRFLDGCRILRFESFATQCRCETFSGHSLNREYENFRFPEAHNGYIINLGQEQLFARWDGDCFSLSPFLHFERDTTGHESYLCFYKGRRGGKYWFEPVKIRTEKAFDHLQNRFETEKDDLKRLLVP